MKTRFVFHRLVWFLILIISFALALAGSACSPSRQAFPKGVSSAGSTSVLSTVVGSGKSPEPLTTQMIIPDSGGGGGGSTTGGPTCGNGVVESGEQCDGGNCCTPDCKLIPASYQVICDTHNHTFCDGLHADCVTRDVLKSVSGAKFYDPARGVTP